MDLKYFISIRVVSVKTPELQFTVSVVNNEIGQYEEQSKKMKMIMINKAGFQGFYFTEKISRWNMLNADV